MGGHDGRNFLTWHREHLAKLEAALIAMNPLVTIPYWDWVNNRAIPPQLSVASDLAEWGIMRGTFNSSFLPSASVINGVMASANFTAFTGALEGPHGWVHGAVGGTMGTSTSPADLSSGSTTASSTNSGPTDRWHSLRRAAIPRT